MPPAIDLAPSIALHTTRTGDARRIAVLRLLGRLEFASTRMVHAMIFPDHARWSAWRTLEMLHAERLVWRVPVNPRKLPGAMRSTRSTPVPQQPFIYGLSPQGQTWLRQQDAEDAATLDTFVVRHAKRPEVKTAHLAHDLLTVDWCVSVIDHARRCPVITGIRCQMEYVSARDERGQAVQRFDALLALTFTRHVPLHQVQPGWHIPWSDQVLPDTADQHTIRFALEIDRGTEKLATLLGKAVMYRELTQRDYYQRTLGGSVLPVVVAPNTRRATQIAREWADGWRGGAGVISSFRSAKHATAGALWGTYSTMVHNPARLVPLLAGLNLTLADWHRLTTAWVPGTPLLPTVG